VAEESDDRSLNDTEVNTMKTTVVAIAAIVGSLLAGCVAGPSAEDMAAVQTGKAQCDRLSTSTARARCEVANANKYLRRYVPQGSLDLADVAEAQMLVLAQKVDAGQMTQAEADLELAQAKSRLISEEQQRNTNANLSWAAWKSAQPQFRTCQALGSSYSATVTCF
jgi:outer membrane murein-binding lipoprotein Lpp